MGRGVSSGGGQSSLGYLLGNGEAPNSKPVAASNAPPAADNAGPAQKSFGASPSAENTKQVPAGIPGNNVNNYARANGQNYGNFITDRPSTKVHAAPGGGSSLGYLFGDSGK